MGLDLHVMPLWRCFAGQFDSPLAQVLGEDVALVRRVGTPKGDASYPDAKAMVEAIRLDLAERGGVELVWRDEGEVVDSVQMPRWGLHALRAYAVHHEQSPNEPFSAPGEGGEHPLLTRVYGGTETRYPHLVLHAHDSGYYLPCEFAVPIPNPSRDAERKAALRECTRPFPPWLWLAWQRLRFRIRKRLGVTSIIDCLDFIPLAMAERYADPPQSELVCDRTGSSPRLLAELDELGTVLGMERDWGQLRQGEATAQEDDPIAPVKTGWCILHSAARQSVAHGLPLVFDG